MSETERYTHQEREAREGRTDALAAYLGTTPATIDGTRDAVRRHAEQTAEDANANGWLPLGPRNVGGAIRCIAVRPSTPAERAAMLPLHMAAGSAMGGLWISRNGGYRWTPAGLPDIAGPVGSVAWSASNREVLYVGTGDTPENHPTGTGIYKSEDGGQTFRRLQGNGSEPGAAQYYWKIVLDPNNADRAWLATDSGLWRLKGGSFTLENVEGLPDGTTPSPVTDVAIIADPSNPNQYLLLAGVKGVGVGVGTYDRTRDRTTWQLTSAGTAPLPAAVGVVRVAWAPTPPIPTAHAIMEDGTPPVAPAPGRSATPLCSSTNLGVSWGQVAGAVSPEPAGGFAWAHLSLAVSPTNPSMIFAGAIDLYRTLDGGVNWVRVMDWNRYDAGDRAQHGDQSLVVFDTNGPARLWSCNDGGLSTSDDFGAATPTWRKRSYGIVAAELLDVTSHPAFPSIYGGGMQDNGTSVSYGGPTWYRVNGGDGGAMSMHPTSPFRFYTTWQGGVESIDIRIAPVGQSDATLPDLVAPNNHYGPNNVALAVGAPVQFFIRAVASHPTVADFILFGTTNALQYSTDGTTVATASVALPAAPGTPNYTTVAFAPSGPDMWAGTSRGEVVYNGAALPASNAVGAAQPAWALRTTLAGAVTAITAHPLNTAVVAACSGRASASAQLMLSHDRGLTWFPLRQGLPQGPYLSLAWDPTTTGTLYVGTVAGVYVARDLPGVGTLAAGSVPSPTWRTFNRGLPLVPVTDLEIHPVTGTLRCSTLGRGAFEAMLTGVTPNAFAIPAVQLLIRNHAADDGRAYAPANTLGADPRVQPAPSAVPPAPAVAPPAGPIDVTRSIDIRIDAPHFTRTEGWAFGEAIDGAEFDEVLVPDRALVGDENVVYVQVQNRGTAVANNVDVHLYYAGAATPTTVPPIDAAFNFPGTPGAASPWTKADKITEGEMRPGDPHVVAFRVIPKLDTLANIAFLAIATSGQDALANVPAGAVDAFVRGERRAALHVAGVTRDTILIRDVTGDRGERGGVAWGGRSPDIIVRQAQVNAGLLATEFANLADAHAGDVARGGNNFVYVRVTNRTKLPIAQSVVRLFRVLRPALTIPGPNGANWREIIAPTATVTNIAAEGWGIAEFPMPLPDATGDDPDPDNPAGQKGIILVAVANVTDGAGTVLDPFPDFADITDVESFWRFFNGGALGNNAAMRALPFTP